MSVTSKRSAMPAFTSAILLSVFPAIRISSTYTAMIKAEISFCLQEFHFLQMIIYHHIPAVCQLLQSIYTFLQSMYMVFYALFHKAFRLPDEDFFLQFHAVFMTIWCNFMFSWAANVMTKQTDSKCTTGKMFLHNLFLASVNTLVPPNRLCSIPPVHTLLACPFTVNNFGRGTRSHTWFAQRDCYSASIAPFQFLCSVTLLGSL